MKDKNKEKIDTVSTIFTAAIGFIVLFFIFILPELGEELRNLIEYYTCYTLLYILAGVPVILIFRLSGIPPYSEISTGAGGVFRAPPYKVKILWAFWPIGLLVLWAIFACKLFEVIFTAVAGPPPK